MNTVIINTETMLKNGHVRFAKHEVDGGEAMSVVESADVAIVFSHGKQFVFDNGVSAGSTTRFKMTVTRPRSK